MIEHFTEIDKIISQIDLLEIRDSKTGSFKFPIYLNENLAKTDVDELDLGTRSKNCLRRAGIHTIGDLCEKISSRKELKLIKNCGVSSANEIMDHLFAYQYYKLRPERREEYIKHVIILNME